AEVDVGAVEAHVAVVWDPQSWWALLAPGMPSPQLDYDALVRAVHAALWRSGATADVVGPGADLTPYRLVLVPALYVVSDETLASFESYVDNGGMLAAWYLSGSADMANRIRPGGYAGGLRDLIGARIEEVHPLPAGTAVSLSSGEI